MTSPTALSITEALDADMPRWDEFVSSAESGTFFHLSGWRSVIKNAFNHRPHYLIATSGPEVEGVLPLVRVRSVLFGDALVSIPFGVYGGAVARTPEIARRLEDAACQLADRLRVDYLELRNRDRQCDGWPTKSLYVTFRRRISPSDDENMKAIPQKQRAMVRKGIKAGLVSRTDPDLKTFYEIYSQSVRNLGTPVFSLSYFRELMREFGSRCEILTVYSGSTPLAAVMSFYFRDEVLPFYGGGTAAAREHRANDFMYWELMRRCAARGIRVFDFGRSKRDSGSYHFKRHWGFEEQPLHYQYHLARSRQMPDLSPANPKYSLAISVWQRLPLRVTQWLGPLIARSLG
jgi:FemAB-related protein (PEP-CTERM system-associated)